VSGELLAVTKPFLGIGCPYSCRGGWMGPRISLDAVEKGRISACAENKMLFY
jgi:hypothetical protein